MSEKPLRRAVLSSRHHDARRNIPGIAVDQLPNKAMEPTARKPSSSRPANRTAAINSATSAGKSTARTGQEMSRGHRGSSRTADHMMNRIDEVRTARLSLSRIGAQHVDDVRLLHGDADVMATLGGVRTLEETCVGLEALATHWKDHGFGPWIARDGGSGAFVGMGGLRRVIVEGASEIEIGYALTPVWWGQGLATELAQAAAHVAFRVLQLPVLVSFTLPANLRSRRVMEKVGFRYERDFVYKGQPQVLYRLHAPTWTELER